MNNIINIYQDDLIRTQTISSLIGFGAGVFLRAFIIENLESLIDFLSEQEIKPKEPKELWKFLEPFVRNKIIDDVSIVICFENILKSELIYKGILVHELRNEKGKEQKKHPIEFQSITDQDKLALGEFTLSISTLVNKEGYYKLTSISDSIRSELGLIISDRNKLHLLDTINISFFKSRAICLREMKEYVDMLIEKVKRMQS